MAIHPTAVIDPQAQLHRTVDVGPYVVIEGPVRVGAHSRLYAHAYLDGWTELGERCEVHPYAVVGHLPQDFHYTGERSYCKVGNGVVIREGANVHRGTQPESTTILGDECFLMAYSHVGHNCQLGRRVKVYNMAALSGHVEIEDDAIVSGYSLVHQFVRIGRGAFIAATARITMDVPPFMMAYGKSTVIRHNLVGMRRAGYSPDDIHEIHQAYRTLYRSGLLFTKAVDQLAETVKTAAGRQLLEFLRQPSRQGICAAGITNRTRRRTPAETDLEDEED